MCVQYMSILYVFTIYTYVPLYIPLYISLLLIPCITPTHTTPYYIPHYAVGAMMSVDDTLMCSFQILKPAEKRQRLSQAADGKGL